MSGDLTQISRHSTRYLLLCIQEFIENPGDRDVVVSSIFTDDMYAQLEAAMKKADGFDGVHGASSIFHKDYRNRKVCVVQQAPVCAGGPPLTRTCVSLLLLLWRK